MTYKSLQTGHCYNPETNELRTNVTKCLEGFVWIGYRKFSTAFTSTNKKYWPLIWRHKRDMTICVDKLPSKLKHKLFKLGIK